MIELPMGHQGCLAKIQHKGYQFLITDRPSDHNIYAYIQELKKFNVTAVVRVCEPSYDIGPLLREQIEVYDMFYPDGNFPTKEVIKVWFEVIRKHFDKNPDACVAVHCVAGLGRAPVMVAISLIELGLKFEEAVEMIREKKRGAINAKQLRLLEKYRRKSRLKMKSNSNSCCVQ